MCTRRIFFFHSCGLLAFKSIKVCYNYCQKTLRENLRLEFWLFFLDFTPSWALRNCPRKVGWCQFFVQHRAIRPGGRWERGAVRIPGLWVASLRKNRSDNFRRFFLGEILDFSSWNFTEIPGRRQECVIFLCTTPKRFPSTSRGRHRHFREDNQCTSWGKKVRRNFIKFYYM